MRVFSNTIRQIPWLHLVVIGTFIAVLAIRQQPPRGTAEHNGDGHVPLAIVRRLFPEAARLEALPGSVASTVFGPEGEALGKAIDTTPASTVFPGYAGPVPCVVGLSPEERVIGVTPFNHSESPSFMEYVAAEGLFRSWNELTPGEAAAQTVDVVTGATATCNAVTGAVRHSLARYARNATPAWETPASFPWRAAAFGLVLTGGLLHALFARKAIRFRPLFMLANILVIGFVVGNMMSLALVRGWVANGIPWQRSTLLALMGLGAVILPLATGRNIYCMFICPYGSAQELVARCWRRRRPRLPRRVTHLLQFVRGALVAMALLTAIRIATPDFAAWEPFAAFRWQSAPPTALALALLFLLVSIVYPRFWCRTLCPTGYLINLCRRRDRGKQAAPKPFFSFERGALITACLAALILVLQPTPKEEDDDDAGGTGTEILSMDDSGPPP